METPALAIPAWLFRVAILAAYFPIAKALVSKTELGRAQAASALSALSVTTALGTVLFGAVVGGLPALGLRVGLTPQLLCGALAALAAGGCLFARMRRSVRRTAPVMSG